MSLWLFSILVVLIEIAIGLAAYQAVYLAVRAVRNAWRRWTA